MENWTPIIDAETVPASKYNDDVARLNMEIYSLRSKLTEQEQQNEKCHETRLKFIDEQFEVLRERDKEIESLRSQLQFANRKISEWKKSQEATQAVADEWKRRAIDPCGY